MRAVLAVSTILLAVGLAAPTAAHVPVQCHPELREFLDLRAEHKELLKEIAPRKLSFYEAKKDFALYEMKKLILDTAVRELDKTGEMLEPDMEVQYAILEDKRNQEEETKQYLESEPLSLLSLDTDATIFYLTRVVKSLNDSFECLADFKEPSLSDYDDLPSGYEALGPLLQDMREFANRPGQYKGW